MHERMLDKQNEPTVDEMKDYCRENAELFTLLNEWLSSSFGTVQKITFPYGNSYGWGIAYRKKQKLICHIFAENNSFTVMVRLSDTQFASLYENLLQYTQEYIDNKYPCGDGSWIHYRVTCRGHFDDIQKILSVKCSHEYC